MPDPLFYVASILERFGWTYDEYLAQPDSLLEVIAIKMRTEAELKRQERERAERLNR